MPLDPDLRNKVYRYCAYQERCQQEIVRKMRELEISAEYQDNLLLELESGNFWNEARFARVFAGGKFRVKQWGRQKIRRELRQRAVPDAYIEAALRAEIPSAEYYQTAERLAQRKRESLSPETSPLEQKQKIVRFLQQKGYEFNIAMEVAE